MLDEQGTTDTIRFGTSGHDVDFQVSNDGTTNSIMVRGDTGFVGINKSVPTAQFHVDGTVLFENLPIYYDSSFYYLVFEAHAEN